MTEEKKEKRYALSKEEKENMERYQRISDDLFYQQQGMRRLMDVELVIIQNRTGIIKDKVPEGIHRQFGLDPVKMELIVTDVPIPKPGDTKITPTK